MIVFFDNNTDALLYDQLVQLEGVEYLFRFIWSDRENSWYVNIYDQDENPLALLIKLICGVPLLRRFRDPRLPPGLLFVADLGATGRDIDDPADLNNNFPLIYMTSDDEALA